MLNKVYLMLNFLSNARPNSCLTSQTAQNQLNIAKCSQPCQRCYTKDEERHYSLTQAGSAYHSE